MFSKLILVYSLTNMGDRAHVESLLSALNRENSSISTVVTSIDANDILKNETNPETCLLPNDGERHYWMVVGENGEKAFNKLYQANRIANTDHVFVGLHQMNLSVWSQYQERVNHLAIPVGALAIAEKTAKETGEYLRLPDKLTQMFAVPTKPRTLEGLESSYHNWEEKWPNYNKPLLNKRALIVTLPGDAPTGDGDTQRLFHRDSVAQLFSCIRAVFDNAEKSGNPFEQVIIQNGPRTGKFGLERPYMFYKKNPETGQKMYELSGSEENLKALKEAGELTLHTHHYTKDTYDAHQPGDPMSVALFEMLQQANMNPVFYEFGFLVDAVDPSKKSVSSFNDPLLYLSMQRDNVHILPGESVSMLGELPLYLKPEQIVVFKPSSMNPSHNATFERGFDLGYYSAWDGRLGVVKNPVQFMAREHDDAGLVAQAISQDSVEARKSYGYQ